MIRLRRLSRHWIFGGLILLYAVLLFSQVDHGIGSLDGNGIVRATRALVEQHRIEISRPPGHPTTECYLLGAVAFLMKTTADRGFDGESYLIIQAVSALVALCIFYELLLHVGTRPTVAVLGAVCLALSPTFLANAVDGEEFIVALLFILLSFRLLLTEGAAPPGRSRLLGSIVCFALATGCRPESIFAGVIYPLFFWMARLGWRRSLLAFAALAVAILLVWLPIILHGVHPPYPSGITWREALMVGAYKICFQCFGPLVFAALAVLIVYSLRMVRSWSRQPFPINFVRVASCFVSLLFFVVFFRYATKPAYVLVALPFLLILGITWSPRFVMVLALLSALETVASIDIFRERKLTHPFLAAGAWERAIAQKPYEKRDYLHELAAQCGNSFTVVIANAWVTDFDYQIGHGWPDLRKQVLAREGDEDVAGFAPAADSNCLLVPRDVAFRTALLDQLRSKGYEVKMETGLYRATFHKFDVVQSASVGAGENAGGFVLFSLPNTKPTPANP